ncbi:MAG: PAS domain-containing protein [Hyphomicrobiales bacterium]
MKKIDTPEGLLRLLADTIPGLIAFLDRNLEYRYLNGQYSEWFGIEPSDYVGKTPLRDGLARIRGGQAAVRAGARQHDES